MQKPQDLDLVAHSRDFAPLSHGQSAALPPGTVSFATLVTWLQFSSRGYRFWGPEAEPSHEDILQSASILLAFGDWRRSQVTRNTRYSET